MAPGKYVTSVTIPKLTEASTVIPLSTAQSARVVDSVASRKPHPEMLMGSIINRPSAGRPTMSAENGAVVPKACKQHQNAVSAIMCVEIDIAN